MSKTGRAALKDRYRKLTNRKKGKHSEVVVLLFATVVTRYDLRSLAPKTWLNDEVINVYFQLLERHLNSEYNSVLVLNSYFLTRARPRAGKRGCLYEQVMLSLFSLPDLTILLT